MTITLDIRENGRGRELEREIGDLAPRDVVRMVDGQHCWTATISVAGRQLIFGGGAGPYVLGVMEPDGRWWNLIGDPLAAGEVMIRLPELTPTERRHLLADRLVEQAIAWFMSNDGQRDPALTWELPMTDPQAELEGIVAADDDHWWDMATAFAKADAAGAWAVAAVAIEDGDPRRRQVAAVLLGDVADVDPDRHRSIAELLRPRLAFEADRDALESLVHAIGHTHDEASLEALAGHARRGDRFVRWAAMNILNNMAMDRPGTLDLFRELTTDPEDMVRDWATSWLAWSEDRDPLTTAALWARVTDDEPEIRAGALEGLLERDDLRAMPLLEREVAVPDHDYWFDVVLDRYLYRTGQQPLFDVDPE